MFNPKLLKQPISRTNFQGPNVVWAIEVRLYKNINCQGWTKRYITFSHKCNNCIKLPCIVQFSVLPPISYVPGKIILAAAKSEQFLAKSANAAVIQNSQFKIKLRRLITIGRFSAIFTRGITIVTSCLLLCTYYSFWKGGFLEKKEFIPKGSKFFRLKVEPFSKGRKTMLTELPFLKGAKYFILSRTLFRMEEKNVDIVAFPEVSHSLRHQWRTSF